MRSPRRCGAGSTTLSDDSLELGGARDGLSPDSLEAAKGNGAMYGTAEYLNGPGIDKPLEIQGILVYRTWRGLIDGGDCLTGICGSTGTIDYPGLTYQAYLDAMPSTQSAPIRAG